MKYPLWQYPIIFAWLFWYLYRCKFRIRAIITWRQEMGLIPKNRKPTFTEVMQFGHWAVGQKLSDIWFVR